MTLADLQILLALYSRFAPRNGRGREYTIMADQITEAIEARLREHPVDASQPELAMKGT